MLYQDCLVFFGISTFNRKTKYIYSDVTVTFQTMFSKTELKQDCLAHTRKSAICNVLTTNTDSVFAGVNISLINKGIRLVYQMNTLKCVRSITIC